jgi:hypothetical protein
VSLKNLSMMGSTTRLTEEHIKDLPPTARRILHNFRVDRKLAQEKHVEEMESLKAAIEKREQSFLTWSVIFKASV